MANVGAIVSFFVSLLFFSLFVYLGRLQLKFTPKRTHWYAFWSHFFVPAGFSLIVSFALMIASFTSKNQAAKNKKKKRYDIS